MRKFWEAVGTQGIRAGCSRRGLHYAKSVTAQAHLQSTSSAGQPLPFNLDAAGRLAGWLAGLLAVGLVFHRFAGFSWSGVIVLYNLGPP